MSSVSSKVEYDVAVIGAGAVGLATSYHLASKGVRVILIEKNYAGSGSSTRNAAGFRVHFNSEHNVKFMVEGRRRLVGFGGEMGWNPIIFDTGYLWLLSTEADLQEFKRLNTMWSSLGVGGRFLDVHEIREVVPELNPQGVLGGFYGPQDGTFHHDLILFGYQEKLTGMGVPILENSPVTGFNTSSGRVRSVLIGSKEIKAEKFVVCAGAWSPQVTAMLGVSLPITPERRELGVTEPIKHFIKPFVISLKNRVYFAQGLRGEIRGGVTDMFRKGYHPLVSTLEWTIAYAARLIKTLPTISNVRLNRQWSGYYEVTPDHSQIMGTHNSWPEGLLVAAGFSGHGMMMSPLAGELMAEYIATGRIPDLMRPYSPERFDENRVIDEAMVF
ncbi:MAG TPA: FAD-binding oxidoreductase [bacterium]|nr:FAD-binding oxidoreductase [bacterium]